MSSFPPEILDLRRRGNRGELIKQHRAFLRVGDRRRISWSAVLLVIILTVLVILALQPFANFWRALLEFVAPATGFADEIALRTRTVLPFVKIRVPYLAAAAPIPTGPMWSISVFITIIVLAVTFFMPRKYLPVIYLLRLGVIIQAISLAYFAVFAQHFPYTLPRYTSDMYTIGLALMALVPLIFGLTYFVFDFGLARKLLIVVFSLFHLAIFIPLQYLMHAAFVRSFSLLYLPILFMLFGALLDISILIAMYGWAMSWRDRQERVAMMPHSSVPRS